MTMEVPKGYRLVKVTTKNVGISIDQFNKIKELKERGKIGSINSFVQDAVKKALSKEKNIRR